MIRVRLKTTGALGTIIEEYTNGAYVHWDDNSRFTVKIHEYEVI